MQAAVMRTRLAVTLRFVTCGGDASAAVWPLATRAQQSKMARIERRTGDRRAQTPSGHAPFDATQATAVVVQRSPPQPTCRDLSGKINRLRKRNSSATIA